MKTKTKSPNKDDKPTEEEIREYAHHLYVSSGWLPGRDLDNWLAAEAHLIAERNARRKRHSGPSTPPASAHPRPAAVGCAV